MQLTMGRSGYSIRQLIRHVGLAAAIFVAVGTPAIYWIVVKHHLEKAIDFKIQYSAERSARYIQTIGDSWTTQSVRLGEIIDYGAAAGAELRQQIVTSSGAVIVVVGERVAEPVLRVSKPIIVDGRAVGQVEGEITLVRSMAQTTIVAIVATLLGFGAYVFLRIVPLRALDRAVERLKAATDETAEANRQLAMKISELETLNEQLETIVESRTAEAETAANEAQRANKVKSAFLDSMSHEIRTPMNGVLGMAELLAQTDLTAHQQRLVSTVNQSAQTLLTIINDILDHSRIESGKLDLDNHSFELRATVESVMEVLSNEAERKGLGLNLFVSPSQPAHYVGDSVRLRQILVNLIGNAIKFTKQGHVEVSIRDLGAADGRQRIEFAVADTGIGIAPDALKELFNPFTQADTTITRRFGGTGLGLSISQSLVTMMGGDITLRSTVGKGTTVTFDILADIDTQATALQRDAARNNDRGLAVDEKISRRTGIPVAATNPLGTLDHRVFGRRLLLAEDNPVNQEVLRGYLVALGYSVVIAENGRQAIQLFKGGDFDLILMDCQMPEMDGLTACKEIRAIETQRAAGRTPIIAVTANAYHADRLICLDAGMDDVLTKPCTMGMMSEALTRWLPEADGVPRIKSSSAGAGLDLSSVLDPSVIRAIDALQWGAATRLVDLYLATAPKTARQIMAGLADGDCDRIAFAAHTLKSSSATIGATRVAGLARDIEARATNRAPLDGMLRLGSQLEAALCQTELVLRETDWGALKRAG